MNLRHTDRHRLLIRHPLPASPPTHHTLEKLAGEVGFEPTLHDPESCVLPLDDSPVPSKKAAEIGQKIQSLLPNHTKNRTCNRLRQESETRNETLNQQVTGSIPVRLTTFYS